MCPKDEYQKIYEFKNFYVIEPSIKFNNVDENYSEYDGMMGKEWKKVLNITQKIMNGLKVDDIKKYIELIN